MPFLYTQFRNTAYHSRDDGAEYDSPESALKAGVRSAAVMASDEIGRGHQSVAVEVIIEQEDGKRLLCSIVAACVSQVLVSTTFESGF